MVTMTRTTKRKTPLPQIDDACCRPLTAAIDMAALGSGVARFKALADPTRLALIALLAASDESICVCELNEFFDLEQPTISHHLKVLRDAGLVRSERRGTWAHYSLHPDASQWVRTTLAALKQ